MKLEHLTNNSILKFESEIRTQLNINLEFESFIKTKFDINLNKRKHPFQYKVLGTNQTALLQNEFNSLKK
jgi:hypothetical protein